MTLTEVGFEAFGGLTHCKYYFSSKEKAYAFNRSRDRNLMLDDEYKENI